VGNIASGTNRWNLYMGGTASNYLAGALGVGTTAVSSALVSVAAGTATVAPIKLTSGTNLTSPVAGALEYDGSVFYETGTTTLGRGIVPVMQHFKLTSTPADIGPTIANFFGTGSGITLEVGAYYELEAELFFRKKTSAGTVTFTLTFTNNPVSASAYYVGSPVGGVGTVGSPQTAGVVNQTSSAVALPPTGSIGNSNDSQYKIYAIFQANATSAGSLNIQITSSAGVVSPYALSNYKVRRIPTANTGAFV
jgi:hypothetical protein